MATTEEVPPPAVVGTENTVAQTPSKADAKDGAADTPKTPATTASENSEAKGKSPAEKKKRKRSVNPAHFRSVKKNKRNFWSQEEVDALLQGVEKVGPGKWTKIKGEFPKIFENRTSLDLKDKWRNIERRPDTNKIAKVSKAKKAAEETKKDEQGVEPVVLTVECDDGETAEKAADNCTAATSKTNDLYQWAIAKFYPSMDKKNVESITLLTDEGAFIPYNTTLKEAKLVNHRRLRAYKKSHAAMQKEKSMQDV